MILKTAFRISICLILLQSCQSESAQETILGHWTTIKATNTFGKVDSTKTIYEFLKDSLIVYHESLELPVYGKWKMVRDTIFTKNKNNSSKLKINLLTNDSLIFSFTYKQDTITTYLYR